MCGGITSNDAPGAGPEDSGMISGASGQFARCHEAATLGCQSVLRWRSINYGH